MATLTVQNVVEAGLNTTYAAAGAGGDEFVNPSDKKTFIHVKNGDSSSHTVTATAQNTSVIVPGYGALTKSDIAVAVPAGEERMIGPFADTAFNDANGKVQLTYDDVTSVTIAVVKL